ncbi:MAG TPA: hypothetical protein VK493_09625, partial [Bryobacteraceae bacterium]|nr:hypothetical protein [Bryobacteraceae bacterium]
ITCSDNRVGIASIALGFFICHFIWRHEHATALHEYMYQTLSALTIVVPHGGPGKFAAMAGRRLLRI